MRILYGVQTTGNGHLSRSSLLVKHLKLLGIEVQVLFSGASQKSFWNLDVFTPYKRYQGLTFITKNGRIDNIQTALNLKIFKAFSDIRNFKDRNFDLVISDFEPLSARIAKKYGIPSMGISHQCAFHYKIPKAKYNFQGKLVTKVFAPVDINLGLHWHHFNQPVLPPIVDTDMRPEDCQVLEKKILVYLPFENRNHVKETLGAFNGFSFQIYEKRDQLEREGNLMWTPFSREGFKNSLMHCDGVICQSGFELPSEAIHLGKKLLVKPVLGQFEQLSNTLAIDQYQLGMTMNTLDHQKISHWLELGNPAPAKYPDVPLEVAKWISSGNWSAPNQLSEQLWEMTENTPRQVKP